ncbi:hypothetical protein NC797_15250 [Aquibacillus sp. 3ASR75-11]|uniref:Uncharacterized protein n=1 Tax=Terrihalobacillus insolitus TaxID=2950438 RepID=A0A9X3WYS4_9BACI|nr:hypothetical protein [Terrihalobacillus insolitus]MDC3415001.1 hypothetical protein [Terrihalobacillus insolitus]MDC3425864.1 hypothetical protein [Terrihalobacillus insolitus]
MRKWYRYGTRLPPPYPVYGRHPYMYYGGYGNPIHYRFHGPRYDNNRIIPNPNCFDRTHGISQNNDFIIIMVLFILLIIVGVVAYPP